MTPGIRFGETRPCGEVFFLGQFYPVGEFMKIGEVFVVPSISIIVGEIIRTEAIVPILPERWPSEY